MGHDEAPISNEDGLTIYELAPFFPKRMKPPTDSSQKEGRINPAGISCLYLASGKQTAISEMRPWKGAYVSVARFKTCRNLKIIDCTKCEGGDQGGLGLWLDLPIGVSQTKEEIADWVWADLDASFSRPVGPGDDKNSYIPTQIIAEHFRNIGFDGIAYSSVTSTEGSNIALFDVANAKNICCHLLVSDR